MKQLIQKHLAEIEAKRGIKILYACETGSRAWGFPSPDSDYDIRLIYKRDRDWYLSLTESKDTLEMTLENRELDITGWDLRKSLRLLKKSNASFLERIQPPIVYFSDEEFMQELRPYATQFYSRIASLFHYLSIAKKSYNEIENEPSYKLKRMFYALRSAAACRWILKYETTPPIQFPVLLDGLDLTQNLRNRIDTLIELKATKDESHLYSGEEDIFKYIKNAIAISEKKGKDLPAGKGDNKSLDQFFVKTLV